MYVCLVKYVSEVLDMCGGMQVQLHASYAEACKIFKKITFILVANANLCAGTHQFRRELGELKSFTSVSLLFLMSSKATEIK